MASQAELKRSTKVDVEVQKITTPDYVAASKKDEDAVISAIQNNPIYEFIVNSDLPKEEGIKKTFEFLYSGIEDNTVSLEELDKRQKVLTEFNTYVQVVRKQLGIEQAREITSKTYADFQRIINQTSSDVEVFQTELDPFVKLADLFNTYGAEGNIIEKLNSAREQKRVREMAIARWKSDQDSRIFNIDNECIRIRYTIKEAREELASKSEGLFSFLNSKARLELEASIKNAEAELQQRQEQIDAIRAESPPEIAMAEDVEQVDEEILKLQDIGGDTFKEAILRLRDHAEGSMAKMSVSFDETIKGLNNTRESFISMDRNCTDASYALSVLAVAVQDAEMKSRIAAKSFVNAPVEGEISAMEQLDRMEREQRSEQILNYTDFLTTFLTDVSVAITSLRSGQATIKNILNMNKIALQSANTHKITGIANTADAVTITIGSIIEVTNRGASRALIDGLTRMRNLAEEGNARLTTGTYESLAQQNEELQSLVDSIDSIKNTTKEITTNSVDLLKQQFELVALMKEKSDELADATNESQRTMYSARSGEGADPTTTKKKPEDSVKHSFGLKVRN